MPQSILILSDDFSANELKGLLDKKLGNEPNLTLHVQKPEAGMRDDPVVVAAIITAIPVLLSTLAMIVTSFYKTEKAANDVLISIKRKDGVEMSFPRGATEKEIQEWLEMAEQENAEIEYIGFDEE